MSNKNKKQAKHTAARLAPLTVKKPKKKPKKKDWMKYQKSLIFTGNKPEDASLRTDLHFAIPRPLNTDPRFITLSVTVLVQPECGDTVQGYIDRLYEEEGITSVLVSSIGEPLNHR
jgi:hypothetical protein